MKSGTRDGVAATILVIWVCWASWNIVDLRSGVGYIRGQVDILVDANGGDRHANR